MYLWRINHLTKLTKMGIYVGYPNIINRTKFGNDQSREYKVTED